MAARDSTTATRTRKPTISQAVPVRRDYAETLVPKPLHDLPFVARGRRGNPGKDAWSVPPIDDYGLACRIGTEYAGHLIQYLKDNPYWVGSNVLASIVASMDFTDESAAKGYRVGFFAHLERALYAYALRANVFAGVDTVLAEYEAVEERRLGEVSVS